MSRDTRASNAHWNMMLASKEKYSYSKDPFEWFSAALERWPDREPPVTNLYRMAGEDWFEGVNYRYSRGDSLDDIRTLQMERAVGNTVTVVEEAIRHRDRLREICFYTGLREPHTMHSVLSILSWIVCFDMDADKVSKIAPFLVAAGEDRLIDTVLQRYQPDRKVADEPACARTFGPLDALVDADEPERAALVKGYLDSWAKRMATLDGLRSVGTANMIKAKSNAALEEADRAGEGYMGFWAWEAALVVRFFEIDDTTFRDHVLYPADLVNYRAD